MAKRRSTIANRISSMRGLPTAEKSLLERIGTLVDSQINNRAPANPNAAGRIRTDVRLPPPRIINTDPGIRTSKISWDAVNSSILSHYELSILNVSDGTTEEFKTFTNVLFFKGREGGTYKVNVRSVGRNGTKSPIIAEKTFFVPEDIMLLEGSKNTYQTIGTLIAEDLYFFAGHKLFAWASFTIDKVIYDTNNTPSVQLYLDIGNLGFANAILLETIPLFSATESATDLDNSALVGISRPAYTGPLFRGTTFETSFSTMFSPLSINDLDTLYNGRLIGNTNTFYLKVIGRESENDITGLSLTLWSANEGQGDQIPAIVLDTEPAFIAQWSNCITLNPDMFEANRDTAENNREAEQYFHSPGVEGIGESPGRRRIGANWTFGMWVKFERFRFSQNINHGSTGFYGGFVVFSKFESLPGHAGGFGYNAGGNSIGVNALCLRVSRFEDIIAGVPFAYIITTIEVGGQEIGSTGFSTAGFVTFLDAYSPLTDDEYAAPTYAAPVVEKVWAGGFNSWRFVTISFNPTDGVTLWVDGVLKIATIIGNTTIGITPVKTGTGITTFTFGGIPHSSLYPGPSGAHPTFNGSFMGDGITPIDGRFILQPAPCRIYSAGMWNISTPQFTAGMAINLTNNPTFNWREPIPGGAYNINGNLCHYWQMGAQLTDYPRWVVRDTGYYIPKGGGFSGRSDASIPGYFQPNDMLEGNVVIVGDHP